MNSSVSQQNQPSWTWADMISTYRFWGVVVFYVLAVGTVEFLLNTATVRALATTRYYSTNNMTIFYVVLALSQLYGFFLGWLGTRTSAKWVLVALTVLQFAGAFLILHNDREFTFTVRFIGAGLRGLTMGAFFLLLPSIIAGGRGNSQTFLLGFGIMVMCNASFYQAKTYFSTIPSATVSPLVLIGVLSVLGLAFLIPAKGKFFKQAPPPRGYALPPEYRDPVTTALKCLIPFYNIYWIYNWVYRAHGEVAWLAPARNLLSPRASIWGAILAPMVLYISEIALVDALNQRAVEEGRKPVASVWLVGFLAFFLNLIAIGVIQSAINRTAAYAVQLAQVSAPPPPPTTEAQPE